ncbi:MAG: hypothetical protein PVH61_20310 [Candidatus Aminicenantes bacterium]
MAKKQYIITDFYPMSKLENFHCATLVIVAIARNLFLPGLNPYNFEVGTFGIDFDYTPCDREAIEQICHSTIRTWKDFLIFFPSLDKKFSRFLEKRIGIKYLKNMETNIENLIGKLENHLEIGLPVIVYCNPYSLDYSEYFGKTPGGLFQTYHHIIVFGMNRLNNKVWVYDPTLNNYYGVISLENLIKAIEDERGIDDFEGYIQSTLQHNGKTFNDINHELLMGSLDYYLNREHSRIKEKMLIFFENFIALYSNLPADDSKHKLLELGFFIFKSIAFRRLHWWEFLEYYQRLKDIDYISEENAAFKVHIDELFGISNILYTNSLKSKKNLNLERLMTKLQLIMEKENSIFCALYEKLKDR